MNGRRGCIVVALLSGSQSTPRRVPSKSKVESRVPHEARIRVRKGQIANVCFLKHRNYSPVLFAIACRSCGLSFDLALGLTDGMGQTPKAKMLMISDHDWVGIKNTIENRGISKRTSLSVRSTSSG